MARRSKGETSGKSEATREAIHTDKPMPAGALLAHTKTARTGKVNGHSVAAVQRHSANGCRPSLVGEVDVATWTCIEGWIWNPDAPTDRIQVELVEGAETLTTVIANDHRDDLAEHGIGDGRHAYRIDLPANPQAVGPRVLHLRDAGTGVAISTHPIVIDPPATAADPVDEELPAAAMSPVVGYVDDFTDNGISGWVAVRDDPTRRCMVMLVESGHILARAEASRFRADLLSAAIGDGWHGFYLPLPLPLLDGRTHLLQVVEEETGMPLTSEPIRWRSGAGTAGAALTGIGTAKSIAYANILARTQQAMRPETGRKSGLSLGDRSARSVDARVKIHIILDISDLIYYLGYHPNLTGIQRVQSSIVLSMVRGALLPHHSVIFVSFNAKTGQWNAIPGGFLVRLLQDLFLPEAQRVVAFSTDEARHGQMPGAQEFDGTGVLDDGIPSVFCLLGAAWVQRDYFFRILSFKRRFGTKFVMMVHDLIPIYAGHTCDQATARVFEDFLRRAIRHVDHYLTVSESTARDLTRYAAGLSLPIPPISITRNGSSFNEFLSAAHESTRPVRYDMPDRFVLFVSTIEGRKNHELMFDIWRRMMADGADPPHLVCVGRVGWRSERFISNLVESNYLSGRIVLLQDIDDALLGRLYERCLFTVYPSLYEGWGLPVGESLAAGKICVCSDRTSLPEVAGACGIYIDINDPQQSLQVIRSLIDDEEWRRRHEATIRETFQPISWHEVAATVIGACEAAAMVAWEEPYPYAAISYGSEISFGLTSREVGITSGDELLTRTTDSRRGYFLPEPLSEESFLLGEDVRGSGIWSIPEQWGTWLCHNGGDIVLSLPPDDCLTYYVFLRVRVSQGASTMPVRLLADSELLWQGSIGDQSRNIPIRVRRRDRATTSWWRLRVRIEANPPPGMLAEIAALDRRVPTVGFERLIVVPESDTNTRLDILTNLLL